MWNQTKSSQVAFPWRLVTALVQGGFTTQFLWPRLDLMAMKACVCHLGGLIRCRQLASPCSLLVVSSFSSFSSGMRLSLSRCKCQIAFVSYSLGHACIILCSTYKYYILLDPICCIICIPPGSLISLSLSISLILSDTYFVLSCLRRFSLRCDFARHHSQTRIFFVLLGPRLTLHSSL